MEAGTLSGHLTMRLYTDGGARGNPGPAAIGIVLCDQHDRPILEHKVRIGRATNNEAEYRALIEGLDIAAGHTHGEVTCFMDSELVVGHLTGRYHVRSAKMAPLFLQVRERERHFARVKYEHRPRLTGHLNRADALVNEALDEAGG